MAVEASSFGATHFMLGQNSGPAGEHFQHSTSWKFPHKDSEGVCWQPEGYDPKTDPTDKELWLDYEDSVSEVMRAECDLQPWMSVCDIPLYWEQIDCDFYIERAKAEAKANEEPEEEFKGLLPLWVVIPVQILSAIWKGGVIAIVALPWWLILATFASIDWVLDWVFLFTFGLFCVPCAGFFIWALNIALLPLTIWGWLMRFMLETFGLVIDGWMLLLRGSGCYLNWGHQCWFKKDRSLRHVLDIPLFFTQPGDQPVLGVDDIKEAFFKLITPPKLVNASDILHSRRQNRKNLLSAVPIIGEFMFMMDHVYQYVDF